jgi:hypothetical protein
MTELMHTTKRILTAAAVALTGALALPQSAAAAVDVEQLKIDLGDVESRTVAPPFFGSTLGTDTNGLKDAIYVLEAVLDFPETGFSSPASTGSVRVTDLAQRAFTHRATLVERACLVVDTAAGGGRPNLTQIGNRLAAIQTAMQYISPAVTLTSRPNLTLVENTVAEIRDIMDHMGAEGSAISTFGVGSIRVSQLHFAVEDIYNRAAHVCANY